MDCTRVEELLALFSGGDLDARQAEAVRAHLIGCPACQAQADELAASRAWLQAAPPPQFDEAFYAGLRQSVLRELPQVETEGGRFAWLAGWLPQWRWQPVLALAATVLLLFAGWAVYRGAVSAPKDALSNSAKATPTPAAPPPDVRKVSDLPGQDLLSYRGSAPDRSGRSPKKSKVTMPVGRRPTTPQAAEPQEVLPQTGTDPALMAQVTGQNTGVTKPAPAQEPEVMRMEFQTADPNIRIIWLTPIQGAATTTTEPLTR
jgi:hypothetical protein